MPTGNPHAGLRLSRPGFTVKTKGHFSVLNDLYQQLLDNDAVRAERLRQLIERHNRLTERISQLDKAPPTPQQQI